MNRSTRTVIAAASLLAAAAAPSLAQETFDQPAPFDWSPTSYPTLVRNGHAFTRIDPCGVNCIPASTSAFTPPVAGCDTELEGRIGNALPGGCEAYGLRLPVLPNRLVNTRIGGFIGHSELFNTPHKAGFVARARTVGIGAARQIQAGYAAVLVVQPGTYQANVVIFRLNNSCLGAATILAVSPPFIDTCNAVYGLSFDVREDGGATWLSARLSRATPAGAVSIPLGGGACHPSAGPGSLCAMDNSAGRPARGVNGTVGYSIVNESVFFDDITLTKGAGMNPDDHGAPVLCPADWNGDNAFNSSDISSYLTTWLANVGTSSSEADYNGDDQTNSSDISAFLAGWLGAISNGC